MKNMVIVFCTTTLLAGCTGLNSEFEHAIPAKDSGYWLHQADEMTAPNNQKGAAIMGAKLYIDVKQYKLINTGNLRLPVKPIERNIHVEPTMSAVSITGQGNSTPIRYEPYDTFCKTKYCYPEPNSPLRESDRISRVWIAPYLSPDNNVHLGEVVYFVSKPSKWAGVEGEK